MSAAKHTPGPWTAWNDDGTGTLPCVLTKQVTSFGNFYVAQCNVFDDARFIAAAPSLLAALENLLMAYRADAGEADYLSNPIVKQALEVIKAAKGET